MTADFDISALFTIFFNRLPNILVYSSGIIYAFMVLRRHPKPGWYVILGLGLLLVQTIGSGLYFSALAAEWRSSDIAELINWLFRLMFIAGIMVLIMASFIDRPARQ